MVSKTSFDFLTRNFSDFFRISFVKAQKKLSQTRTVQTSKFAKLVVNRGHFGAKAVGCNSTLSALELSRHWGMALDLLKVMQDQDAAGSQGKLEGERGRTPWFCWALIVDMEYIEHNITGWWQLKYVLFSPRNLGKIPILNHIVQRGWFNDQLVIFMFLFVFFFFQENTLQIV